MSNTKTQKKKPYNPFRTVTVKTTNVGKIRLFIKAVKPNMKDYVGMVKIDGKYYNNYGRPCAISHPMQNDIAAKRCIITR